MSYWLGLTVFAQETRRQKLVSNGVSSLVLLLIPFQQCYGKSLSNHIKDYQGYSALSSLAIYFTWLNHILHFRHFVKICQGERAFRKVYPQSMLLNCLQAFSESAYQFLLQVCILMLTWRSIGKLRFKLLTSLQYQVS